jgi:hypothetical protein
VINIEFTSNIFLGIFVIFAVCILYFLRTIKYEVSRDIDIFFATLGFAYSFILIIHGWRLDPILILAQFLIVITIIYIGWENIRLRGIIINYKNQKIVNKKNNTDKKDE